MISFRVKTIEIKNQYDLYSRNFTDVSFMLEVVDFLVSYTPVASIKYLIIVIAVAYTEVIIIFILDIYNAFQNIILPNFEEIVYLGLPHICIEWF